MAQLVITTKPQQKKASLAKLRTETSFGVQGAEEEGPAQRFEAGGLKLTETDMLLDELAGLLTLWMGF